MPCPACGQAALAGARFCTACGAALPVACPACGHVNPPGSRFCARCGRAISAAPAELAARFVAPGDYTPKHLVDRVLTSRAALEGERKQVTVLFADIKSSMELLADRDPEDARKILDPVLERMMEAVHRYEGTVNQVMGDGIMALFGAPLALEDHAARACYAAARMQDAIARYGDRVHRTLGIPLQIRVGLNSGVVVVRSVGSDLRMDYTAVGETTHLAARMEQMAKPGSTMLTAETLRLAEANVDVEPLGPVEVRGVAKPVSVYRLLAVRPAAALRMAGRALSPFVGRDLEIDQLRRALDTSRGGRGQVVALVGEPGIGKTRLVHEMTRSLGDDVGRLETTAISYEKSSAYLPVVRLFRAFFRLGDTDTPDTLRARVSTRLAALDERLTDAVDPLLLLLDALPPQHPLRAVDAADRHANILTAVRRTLFTAARRQPLVVVFENLHWADAATLRLLDGLVDGLPGAPVLLLVTYRPEFEHRWASRAHYAQIRLDPLGAAGAGALLRGLAGDDPSLAPLARLLVERTAGNPFFIEETVRALAETGALVGERGRHRLVRDVATLQVPPTVQALLAARIDRLDDDAKTVLQAAAVLENRVRLPLLLGIVDLPEATMATALGTLRSAEFLYEDTLLPEPSYSFKHALTQEVAYRTLLHDQRRALHARVVGAFERLYPERLDEASDLLAHHVARGEVWSKAQRYFRQAAEVAEPTPLGASPAWWRGNYEAARERALLDLAAARDYRNFVLAALARLRLGQIEHSLGDYRRAVDFLRANIATLTGELEQERFGMPGVVAVLSRAWAALALGDLGEVAESASEARAALAIAESAGDPYSAEVARWSLAQAALAADDPDGAMRALGDTLGALGGDESSALEPYVAATLGVACARRGDAARGVALVRRARERAEVWHLEAARAWLLTMDAEARGHAGDAAGAQALAREALALAHERGERGIEARAESLLGWLAGLAGDRDTARRHFARAADLAEVLGMRRLAEEARRSAAL